MPPCFARLRYSTDLGGLKIRLVKNYSTRPVYVFSNEVNDVFEVMRFNNRVIVGAIWNFFPYFCLSSAKGVEFLHM